MTNPFDLRGPEFLLFYLLLGILSNLILRYLIIWSEKRSTPAHWDSTDPYKIACLRAGINEVLRVVLVSLIDRGLLKATEARIKAERKAGEVVRRPVEKAIAHFFAEPSDVKDLFFDPDSRKAAEEYQRQLQTEGLLADANRIRGRANLGLGALIILLSVSLTKIAVAISRGRYNLLYLIILTIVFCYWTYATWHRERTGAGDEIMRRMTGRFKTLKQNAARIRPGGMTNDVAFLVAVFSVTALSADYFPYVRRLFPQASSTIGGTSYTGGCGSAGCGSSGFTSGCGGGGCGGGGCGGCGGG